MECWNTPTSCAARRARTDGLYWPAKPGENSSPLGPLIAQAHIEGYRHETKIMTDEQSRRITAIFSGS